MMKKILVSVLAVLVVMLSLCSCTQRSGGYKVLNLPKELSIDAGALSEDADNLLNMDEDYPLLLAKPEDDLFVYAVNPSVMQGVVVKFGGLLQYFPWEFIPQLAQPEAFVYDYDGDGQKDIALTYVEESASPRFNETLHVLLYAKKGMQDCIYTYEKAASEAGNHIMVEKKSAKDYVVYVDGVEKPFSMQKNYGEFLGVYTQTVQDFTLGETISVAVNPGLVFDKTQEPVYSAFRYRAQVTLVGETLTQIKSEVVFGN